MCRTWLFNQVRNIRAKIVHRISYSCCCPIRISNVSMFESLWSKSNLLLTASLLCNVLEFIESSLFARMRHKRVRNSCNVQSKVDTGEPRIIYCVSRLTYWCLEIYGIYVLIMTMKCRSYLSMEDAP